MSGSKKGADPNKASGGFLESQGKRGDIKARVRPENLSQPDLDHPRPWTKLPRQRRTKLSIMGLDDEYLSKGDPRYKRAMWLANTYRKARSRELAAIHGFVSSGASSLLATASLALAASRYLYELFAETSGKPDFDTGSLDILRKASALADSARQAELAAWELAAREALIKRKLDLSNETAPWMVNGGRMDKRPRGRPRNATIAAEAQFPALPSKREMTIDEVITVPAVPKEDNHVVESNRRSTVSQLPGVSDDAQEPDGRAGAEHGAVPSDSGAKGGTEGKGRDDRQADASRLPDEPDWYRNLYQGAEVSVGHTEAPEVHREPTGDVTAVHPGLKEGCSE